MFEASGVKFRQFVPKCGGFRINLKSFSCEEFSPPFMSREISLDLNHGQCIPWEDFFSALCILVSKRSKSPELQLGAVIVNEDHIVVSQGYNGLPFNCNDDDFPWGTGSDDALENKDLYECHAELNAILNTGVEVKGCTIYCISFPCNECAKAIIQSGIKIVVYLQRQDNRPEVLAAQRMFDAVQVVTRQHSPSIPIIHVDFNLIKF